MNQSEGVVAALWKCHMSNLRRDRGAVDSPWSAEALELYVEAITIA